MTMPLPQEAYRAWAEVDLDSLTHNLNLSKKLAHGKKIIAIVKADAYGHGAAECAKALSEAGADLFAVATAEEAFQLRRHGVTEPILILGVIPASAVPALADADITLAVGSVDCAKKYAAALNGKTVRIHIKLDTGLTRLGLNAKRDAAETAALMREIASVNGLELTGVFTHFAMADFTTDEGKEKTRSQYSCFSAALKAFADPWPAHILRHCANSAAILCYPDMHLDAVRAGIILYGYDPFNAATAPLKLAMALKTTIVQISEVRDGDSVSYGTLWRANGNYRLATLGIGYSDGLFRQASSKAEFYVHGKPAPQVGRICMDMCMLDVTNIPEAQPGDVVTIFGPGACSAEELGAAGGAISYDTLCAVSKRVPRVYLKSGKVAATSCALDML